VRFVGQYFLGLAFRQKRQSGPFGLLNGHACKVVEAFIDHFPPYSAGFPNLIGSIGFQDRLLMAPDSIVI
jgi:hypothetical protein